MVRRGFVSNLGDAAEALSDANEAYHGGEGSPLHRYLNRKKGRAHRLHRGVRVEHARFHPHPYVRAIAAPKLANSSADGGSVSWARFVVNS